MQDRFKFRGIHPVLNELQEIKFIDFIHNTVDFGDGDIFNIEDVKIQQCTGLKDKNGRLIYEGDIVKFGEFYDNEWNSFDIGKVYWGGKFDYPAFEVQCSTVDFDMSNGLSYIFGNGLNIEVIGNIYKNPELLEVE